MITAAVAHSYLQRTLTAEARNIGMPTEVMVPLITPALAEIEAELPPVNGIGFDGVVIDSTAAGCHEGCPCAIVSIDIATVGGRTETP